MTKTRYIQLLLFITTILSISMFGCSEDGDKPTSSVVRNDTITDTSSQVSGQSEIYILDTLISYDYFQDTASIAMFNAGEFEAGYSIAITSPYFNEVSVGGNILPNDTTRLNLSLNRSAIPSDTLPIETYVLIHSNDSLLDSVPTFISNYRNDFWSFSFKIVDAEYCRAIDRIVIASIEPRQLHLIDPTTKQIQSIDLVLDPKCVSIRSDGKFVAVGHDAYVSYIDIENWKLEEVFSTPTNIADIALPSNGWIYASSAVGTFGGGAVVKCIEISSGNELTNIGGAGRTYRFRLHPSENYIYGAEEFVNPDDMLKFDLRSDTAKLLNDWPYHGQHTTDGLLWFSEDGSRIYTRGGGVFASSEIESEDMVLLATFAGGYRGVSWVDHSDAAGRVYFLGFNLGGWVPNYLFVLDSESLSYLGTVYLTRKLIRTSEYGGTFYPMTGTFAFTNSVGTELYLLGIYQDESGQAFDWGMYTLQTDDLP